MMPYMLANPKPLSQIQTSSEHNRMYNTILPPGEVNEHGIISRT